VSLGILDSTFQGNLVVSYSRVEILRNISIHGYMCACLFRNVGNQLTNNKASHQRRILNAVDRIQDGFWSVLKQVRCRRIWSTRF